MSTAQAIAERDQTQHHPAPQSESAAILDMIGRMAADPQMDPDRIERFWTMKERIDTRNAKLAFSAAISEAKAEIAETPIVKNQVGNNSKRYADFSAYARVIDPILARHGLTYRFRTEQSDRISVTCILTGHGHEEANTLTGPADKTGSKNDIQAIGSTLTYLQRYTLVQALGLAASDDDNGAAAGKGDTITDEHAAELRDLVKKAGGDEATFCKWAGVDAIENIPATRFDKAKLRLTEKIAAASKASDFPGDR